VKIQEQAMHKISLVSVLVLIILTGCISKEEVCDIRTLMLEESFFQGNVLSEPLDSPIPDAPPESAEQIIYIETDISIDVIQHDIMNFGNSYMASKFWENGQKQVFKVDAYREQWETPKEIVGFNLGADQSHLACGIVLSSKTCRWLARYKSYYVYLRSDISDIGMTTSIFVDAVNEIDARMVQCVDR